jgi:hypothetical protein
MMTVEPGEYTLYVGSSASDIRLKEKIVIDDKPPFSVQNFNESMLG